MKMKIKDINKGQRTLVDVRTPDEYTSGHVPGAINIPLDQIQSRVDEFKDLPKPIIAYCRSGARSGMASSILIQAGIQDVINGGGISEIMEQIN